MLVPLRLLTCIHKCKRSRHFLKLAVPCLELTASACLAQQKVGVFEHATLEVLVLSRCWIHYSDYDECNLMLRYTRLHPLCYRFRGVSLR